MNVTISIDEAQTQAIIDKLSMISHGVEDALSGGINDTIKKAKTRASTGIREKVNIKKKDIDPYLDIHRATREKLEGSLTVKPGRRIGLAKFGATQNSKGISYRISKDGPRGFIPGGFGHPKGKRNFHWVAKRVSNPRKPLRFPKGVSAYGVFKKGGVRQIVQEFVAEYLSEAIARRIDFILGVWSGRINRRIRGDRIVTGEADAATAEALDAANAGGDADGNPSE